MPESNLLCLRRFIFVLSSGPRFWLVITFLASAILIWLGVLTVLTERASSLGEGEVTGLLRYAVHLVRLDDRWDQLS